MHNGLNARIIAAENYQNLTIEFENGVIKTGVAYRRFREGMVALRSAADRKASHAGETRDMP